MFSYLAIGLFFSAFFSATEAAFLSLDKIQKNKIRESKSFFAKLKTKIIDEFNYFIMIILVGNIFFNVLATIEANRLFFSYFSTYVEKLKNYWVYFDTVFDFLFIILFTGLVLVFAELIPKLLAIRYTAFLISVATPVLNLLYIFLSPIMLVIKLMSKIFLTQTNRKKIKKSFLLDKGELIGFISRGKKEGSLKKIESLLMETTISYINTSIKSFLINRDEIEGINLNKHKNKNLINVIKAFPHKNIPIYRKQKDNIVGVLSKKKLAFLNLKNISEENIEKYMDEPRIISENKNVLEVLNEIINSNSNIALIIDEYGGVEGIVNKNDIINKVIKKSDFANRDGFLHIKKIDGFSYYVKAGVLIDDINKKFKTAIKCENAETIGGYLLEKFQEIPTRNQTYQDEYFTYIVKSSYNHKINSLILKPN